MPEDIAEMAARATADLAAGDGIDVVSARPHWVEVRVNCSLVNAERLLQFLSELRTEVPGADREGLLLAFREVLLNAMEHGAALDPESVVQVAAVRTDRAIVLYVKDPGEGFPVREPSLGEREERDLVRRVERGESARGFGLLLSRTIVDELIHSEHGNEVLLIKHTQ